MTCYMRHMGWLLSDLGMAGDPDAGRRLDAALKTVLNLPVDTPCPQVWAEVKAVDGAGWAELMPELRVALGMSALEP